MRTGQQLPKNIRQIGRPSGHRKVYVEDYVITFLTMLAKDHNTFVRGAILFGEKETINQDEVVFIRGAIEGQNLELDLDETVFDDQVWREIYQEKERYFPTLQVMGWALSRMGFSIKLNDKIKKTHFENFPEKYTALYMIDQMEREDGFYLYDGQDLVGQNGYYIYYEKNPMMQDYLVERNQQLEEERAYENMLEAKRDEKVVAQFREKVSGKKKQHHAHKAIRRISSFIMTLAMVGLIGSMYQLAKEGKTVTLKDAVKGAVDTMEQGVNEQIQPEGKQALRSEPAKEEHKSQRVMMTTAQKIKKKPHVSHRIYTVKRGDTIASISRSLLGTQRRGRWIKRANHLKNGNVIYPGQKLIIPSHRK